jgi:ElaB/YqjD/DUF883 family membrane-anchored ribosome-binding protein
MNTRVLKSISDAGAAVVGEVENAATGAVASGADLAGNAGRQAGIIGSELEAFVRKNPIASVGGAAAVGLLVGLAVMARSGTSR